LEARHAAHYEQREQVMSTFKPCKECETPLACTGRRRCAFQPSADEQRMREDVREMYDEADALCSPPPQNGGMPK
jgi:hypothetical protein